MYKALDIFFLVLHTSVIIFNSLGWVWIKTRKANLVLLLTTAGSWLFLGLIVGTLGYCPLTDWHFNVLYKLGETDLPVSYVKYLADRILGTDFNSGMIDSITLWMLVASLLISIVLNFRDYKKKNADRSLENKESTI